MLKKVISLFAVMILTVTVITGCAGTPTEETTVETGGKVQEYLDANSDELSGQFDTMASMLGEGSSFELKGVGDDELVFSLKFGQELPAGVDTQALESTLEMQGTVFAPMADALETEIGVDNLKITVEYLDNGGTVLATQTFEGEAAAE